MPGVKGALKSWCGCAELIPCASLPANLKWKNTLRQIGSGGARGQKQLQKQKKCRVLLAIESTNCTRA
jgi:hypothetical protein